ncbi:vitamin K epoxide reductase family protein [Chlorogloea sp. CCALA 695]|uniref:vitamin K epoxide reductase family protein n=1 Tax=Chlorogloea sp. CCALA 695 TaxID=2107693 RepID=UPI000D06EE83|nr:vitamin K epoxide reductase family protein [Chlorogloea sp. CCALA 695]PSB30910.1 hypothetical protein C7B70_15205 [Chlorogloea sp. CCALA 695]
MKRKRSLPWIHRWSRPLMAGIASVGAAVTGYLAIVKLTGNSTACPTNGCDLVLSSPYATVFGLPLALFGFLAYASMIVFALAPLLVNSSKQVQLRSNLENWTGLLLVAGGTAMTVFSGYLMYLLAFKIQVVCIYCVGSALLSATLFTLALIGREWQDIGQLFFTAIVVGMLVLIGTTGIYAGVNNPALADRSTPGESGLPITTASGTAEIALAKHLKQVEAKMYGAFWCPHCHEQKQLFGQEASQSINYIECDPKGKKPQPELCEAAKIESFPTWKIKGKSVSGTQSLEELAAMSGYQGARNFRNSIISTR